MRSRARGRDRTCDPPGRNRLLCPLSYASKRSSLRAVTPGGTAFLPPTAQPQPALARGARCRAFVGCWLGARFEARRATRASSTASQEAPRDARHPRGPAARRQPACRPWRGRWRRARASSARRSGAGAELETTARRLRIRCSARTHDSSPGNASRHRTPTPKALALSSAASRTRRASLPARSDARHRRARARARSSVVTCSRSLTISSLWGSCASARDVATSLSNRVRFDAVQSLTTPQKLQACTNLGIGDPEANFAAAYAAAKV